MIWRLGMPYLPVFEECRLVTNVHRIGETIGDAWPLVAVDRVHRGKMSRERQTFSENQKHFTYHENAIRHRGSLKRLRTCVNATAASPLGDVSGIKRPIADDASPMTLPDCGVCRYLRPSELQRLQHDHAAEERDRVCAPGPVRRGRIGRIGGARRRRPVMTDPL